MRFAIFTHVIHKKKGKDLYAYEPYVREMNLWLKYVDNVKIVAPIIYNIPLKIDEKYIHSSIKFSKISSFNALTFLSKVKSILVIPIILFKIFRAMFWANHLHLRCPGNIGLLACFVQIFFPFKPKTVKYAGNWDPKSKQPLSYRIQKWILSNTFLTRNCKVLVYGEWKNQTKNIVPFFTASYQKSDIEDVDEKDFLSTIKFIFVGAFTEGKQPLLSVKVIEKLISKNIDAELNMFGSGSNFKKVKEYVKLKNLVENVFLHGNQSKETVKKAFQNSHFLIFISKSEGWPKVVAESMFWNCLPISSKVSCVENMLGNGSRGSIVSPNVKPDEIVSVIEDYIKDEAKYKTSVLAAKDWSQQYTLDKFENEIKKFLINE